MKFLKMAVDVFLTDKDLIWKVPITFRTKSSYPQVHSRHLFEAKNCEIDCGILAEGDWILLNHDYTGFYRSSYSEEMFEAILVALEENPGKLGSCLDRIGILNDSFALVNKC